MLKEIHEQADAVAETIADRTARGDGVDLGDLGAIDDELPARRCGAIVIVACGTSYHAGLIGRYAIEEWARVRRRDGRRLRVPLPQPGGRPGRPRHRHLAVGRDRRHAGRDAARRASAARRVLALTNVMGSQATRDADGVLFTRAGLEIGVAATKTFVAQVAAMYLLGLRLAELRGTLAPRAAARARRRRSSGSRTASSELLRRRRGGGRAHRRRRHHGADFFLYLGRHVGLPVALEGALKLKEISYIATDAYAAGEMKHGPIALLDEATPVVVRRHRLAGAREGRLEHAGGPRPRRARDRGRDRGQRRRSPSTPRRSSGCRGPTGCSSRCSR